MANTDTTRQRNGRKHIDWDAAEVFYLALDPGQRTFTRVAHEFHVSKRRVGTVARERDWRDKAAAIDARVAVTAQRRVVRSLEDRQAETIAIADKLRSIALADDAEIDAAVAIRALPQFAKLEQLFAGEDTDRVGVSEAQAVIIAIVQVAGRYVPKDRRDEFLRDLDSATEGLVALEAGAAA